MDLFSKIREEHKEILGIVDSLVGADPATHRKAMDDLTFRILAHMNAEEQSIYQAFEELDAVPRSLALRHEQEHHVAKMIMNELQDRVSDYEVWNAKLQVFHALLLRHAESEERTMFDMASDYFNDEEIRKMTDEFDRVEDDLLKVSMTQIKVRASGDKVPRT